MYIYLIKVDSIVLQFMFLEHIQVCIFISLFLPVVHHGAPPPLVTFPLSHQLHWGGLRCPQKVFHSYFMCVTLTPDKQGP
jgi:hypothetical protein